MGKNKFNQQLVKQTFAQHSAPVISEERLVELTSLIGDSEGRLEELKKEQARITNANATVNTEYVRKKGDLEESYKNHKAGLDAVINERKTLINEIDVEREKLVKDIFSALAELKNSSVKSGEGFGSIYEKATEAARTQLVSALSEAEKVIADLIKFGDELHKSSEEHAKSVIETRAASFREVAQWREKKLADIEAEMKTEAEKNKAEAERLLVLKADLDAREGKLRAEKSGIDAAVQTRVNITAGEIARDRDSAVQEAEGLYDEIERLRNELDRAKRAIKETTADDKAELKRENNKLLEENRKLIEKTRAEYLQGDIMARAGEYDKLKAELDKAYVEVTSLRTDNAKLKQLPELSRVLEQLMDAGSEKIDELKEQLNKLKGDDYSAEFRRKPIEKPFFNKQYTEHSIYVNSTNELVSELDWLAKIGEGIKGEGFEFSNRLLYAFHTCVKTAIWSPITVLAGVSGTGKSELPRLYSQYGGFLFANTPVKPDWDSPSSMLGYYNALERKFEAQPLLRAMFQMQNADGGLSKQLAMFLLDEMNLAHVELYFADMLSKLEENRNKNSRESAQIDIDLGAGIDALPIRLTRNMCWVGTMNEDETTKGLSDKVVDRSNIITFPRPKQLVSRQFNPMLSESTALLKKRTWDYWQTKHIDLCNSSEFHKKTEPYRQIIETISSFLEVGGRALGHRVWQSIEHYMAAHPLVINKIDASQPENVLDNLDVRFLDAAFAEAVAFKVMPKLRGVETEGKTKRDCLNPIGEIISSQINGLENDYNNALKSPYGVFIWKSGEFLTQEIEG